MSISLVKGQKIDLTKGNAGLRKVVFALGWDLNRYDGDAEFDLDVSLELQSLKTKREFTTGKVTKLTNCK